MTIQPELFDNLLRLEEGKEYDALQITDKIKGYYKNKPFYAINNTIKTKDRIYYCDFNPRKKYMYKGKWCKIKKKRELSTKEKFGFLNVYDKHKHEFRKIDIKTLSYLRIGRQRFRVDQVDMINHMSADRFSVPKVTVKNLP